MENLNLVKPEKVQNIINKFCYTIGMIPTSYKMSLTYEEQIIAIGHYLEETVIPALNNNAEAVAELQALFVQLKDYVENYFDNLDVQKEIDNKLNQMAQDGTLQEIITSYLQVSGVLAFNTVSDMKQSTNLINGSLVQTYGFHSINDEGNAKYKIRNITNQDTVNNMTLIALNNVNLVAELIADSDINVKQLGAKGNGIDDETSIIQFALNNFTNIYIPGGIYMINSIEHLFPKSNTKIILDKKATLKSITNNSENYSVIRINDVENVEISGGNILGDRETHTGTTGEWGYGIEILNATNIKIENMLIQNCWGDGIYVNGATNVITQNIISSNNRRQGLSIINANNFKSINDIYKNTNGTAPQAGIDIEPNLSTDVLKNIVFENVMTENNSGAGFAIFLGALNETSEPVSIFVNNMIDNSSINGISISKNELIKGTIEFNKPVLNNSKLAGINLRQCYYSECYVTINEPKILNCNTSENNTKKYGSSICLYLEDSDAKKPLGNVNIFKPYCTNKLNSMDYVYFVGSLDNKIKNINFIDPLNNDNKIFSLNLRSIDKLNFTDNYEQFTIDTNNTIEISGFDTISKLYNSTYTASRNLIIDNTFPIGRIMTFINNNISAGYDISVKFPDNCIVAGLSSEPAPTVSLTQTGDLLTIQRISETMFIVLNKIGNLVVS